MATAIKIQRIEPGFYRLRSDAVTPQDAREIATEVNQELSDVDELKDFDDELEEDLS